jgi:hypothetical protein
MFGNWLNGIDKKLKHGFEWGFVLFYGQYGIVRIMLSLIKLVVLNFCMISTSLPTGDQYVVLPSTRGSAHIYGLWMYSFDGDRSSYLQLG